MNWYFKTIISQVIESNGLIGYLERLGTNPDIINYITSLDKNRAQILTNEVRKNPNISLVELQQIEMPEKVDPYLEGEKHMANLYPEIKQWVLVSYRKLRKGRIPKNGDMANYGLGILTTEEERNYYNFNHKLQEIYDWFRAINPDISSYSPEEAIATSDEWHRMMAGEGEGKNYEPTNKELIVYGPNWINKEFNGWTIQEVRSENDLLTEGNRMSHCVGSYCEDVARGSTHIYSLRDPSNHPHTTIEIDQEGFIEQMKGNSNNEPDEKYRPMIKEWIENDNSTYIQKEVPLFETEEDANYDSDYLFDALNKIGKTNEYGLTYYLDQDGDQIAQEIIETEEKNAERARREDPYRGDITYIPEALIDALVKTDQNDNKQRWRQIYDFEKYIEKISQEQWEDMESWGMDFRDNYEYPNEEDFETEEEYEKVREKIEEEIANDEYDIYKKTIKGGFSNNAHKYINELREKGIIPSYEAIEERNEELKKKYKESLSPEMVQPYEIMERIIEDRERNIHPAENSFSLNYYKKAKKYKDERSEGEKLDTQLLCCGYPENRRKDPYKKNKEK